MKFSVFFLILLIFKPKDIKERGENKRETTIRFCIHDDGSDAWLITTTKKLASSPQTEENSIFPSLLFLVLLCMCFLFNIIRCRRKTQMQHTHVELKNNIIQSE